MEDHFCRLCSSIIVIVTMTTILLVNAVLAAPPAGAPDERVQKTATIGEDVILACPFEYPDGTPVPYLVQWHKKDHKIPIYIWYDGYPPHASDEYKERVSLSGRSSLNLTNVRVSDKGWYECMVFFLSGETVKNGSWIYLDVLAPPHFKAKPPETLYVKKGETLILPCKAQGTPSPTVSWEKNNNAIDTTSEEFSSIQINEHQLKISNLRQSDVGEYQCIARNSEGSITATSRVIIAGPAKIITRPTNTTRIEGNVAELSCETRALPSNITHKWLYKGIEISKLTWLQTRTLVRQDGALFINPTAADDSGWYTCEVSNGIGEPETATAFLNIEYPARVNFTPNFQYMPLHLPGMIKCYVTSNPPLQFVTWFKDKKPYEANTINGVVALPNGTLYFNNVSKEHEGGYLCSPFNIHGTGGASKVMEVLVREPPAFSVKPKEIYQQRKNADVVMVCEGKGLPMPTVSWRRADSRPLPKQRFSISQEIVKTVSSGNLTLKSIQKEDHGHYECILQNEVATLVTSSLLLVESTTPHAPTNVSVATDSTTATVSWLPGYDGGHEQSYILWYRPEDRPKDKDGDWRTIRVHPDNVTSLTIHSLQPETAYQFQVLSRNEFGDGFFSERVVARTTKYVYGSGPATPGTPLITPAPPTEPSTGIPGTPEDREGVPTREGPEPSEQPSTESEPHSPPSGPLTTEPPIPRPDAPLHVEVSEPHTEKGTGRRMILVSWIAPQTAAGSQTPPIAYFNVEYKQDESHAWTKSPNNVPETPSQPNMQYSLTDYPSEASKLLIRVVAYSHTGTTNASPDKEISIPNKHGGLSQKYRRDQAIVSGIVGGILFFFVAIILSVCAVKICNKRRRRKAEKAYMMVTCGGAPPPRQANGVVADVCSHTTASPISIKK